MNVSIDENQLSKEDQNHDSDDIFDLWRLLERSAKEIPPSKNIAPVSQSAIPNRVITVNDRSIKGIFSSILTDLIATTIWIYVLLKMLVFDVDLYVVSKYFPALHWLVDLKSIIFLSFISIIGLFLWRWDTLFVIAYIVFFPLIVLFWKIPMLFVKLKFYKSWVFWIILFNSVVVFIKNLRYYIWSISLGIVSLVLVYLSGNLFLIIPSAICLSTLLAIDLFKLVKGTFQQDWFLTILMKVINVIGSAYSNPVAEARKLAKPTKLDDSNTTQIVVLENQDLQNVTAKIQVGIIATRVLYLVAYKLQQYRQLQLCLIFNFLSFGKIIILSIITFTSVNYTLLKIDPAMFSYNHYPSVIAMALYSLSGFAFSDGAGISPNVDASYLFRIISGLYGAFFIGTFFVNIIITARNSREDIQLKHAVNELRNRAKSQESEFKKILNVEFEEAFKRLVALGLGGMAEIFNYLSKSVPIEFLKKNVD